MIGTIRKHQAWLWVIIAAVMIVSLVMYFNPASRGGGGRQGEGNYGTIGGQQISDADFQAAKRVVELGYLLRGKHADPGSAQVQIQIYEEILFLDAKAKELGIQITDRAAADLGRSILSQAQATPEQFQASVLTPNKLDQTDFENFCRHTLTERQLVFLTGLSGALVTPQEAETVYRAEKQEVAAQMVYFPISNYLAQVTNSPAAVAEFYSNNVEKYSEHQKVVVNYVQFDVSNYLAQGKAAATNLDQMVESVMRQAGTNLPVGTTNADEAKAYYRGRLLQNASLKAAGRAANAFSEQLDAAGPHPEVMEALARSNGFVMHTTQPFDESGPSDLNVSTAFIQSAFQLSPDLPFSRVLPGGPGTNGIDPDAVYVIGYKQQIAATNPPFSEIQSKVTEDYKEEQARALAQDAAAKFDETVKSQLGVDNGITLPKTFAMIAADEGQTVQTLPPISEITTNLPREIENLISLDQLKGVVLSTTVGSVSRAVSAENGALVVYSDKTLPLDTNVMTREMPLALDQMRGTRQYQAFNLWINTEINRDKDLVATLNRLQGERPAQPQSR